MVSLLYNSTIRLSLKTYGGINWAYLTGFEQVVTNGAATYYAIDFGSSPSRIVTYNQFWIYQGYQSLPCPNTYTVKYVGGYFYFSSDFYFYKTNSSFSVINYFYKSDAYFRQIVYDQSSSKFYVSTSVYPPVYQIYAFDSSCSPLPSINLMGKVFGLAAFDGRMYASTGGTQIGILLNGQYNNYFSVYPHSNIASITFDSFGYMAISCDDNKVVVYDRNGNYMQRTVTTLNSPYVTAIDSNGRFVIMTKYSLDIYY